MKKICGISLLCIIFTAGICCIAYAGISVDPVILETVVHTNKPTEGVFRVKNTGTNPVRIRVIPEKQRGGGPDISKWLSMDPKDLQIAQGREENIKYRIIPPVNADGELRCMVFFIADELGEKKSNVGIRFGVPIYAVIGETVQLGAEILDVEVTYKDSVMYGKIYIDNKSNIHIRPNISISVRNDKGKNVYSFFVPYGQPAQAGQNRMFMFQETKALPEGMYKIYVEADYGRLYGLKGMVSRKKAEFEVKRNAGEENEKKN